MGMRTARIIQPGVFYHVTSRVRLLMPSHAGAPRGTVPLPIILVTTSDFSYKSQVAWISAAYCGHAYSRIIKPGVFYHVTSRVNHKEMLLRSLVAKKLFLEQLIRLRLRHTCENLDFVVMENHVHLILRPVGEAQRDSPSDLDRGVL